MKKIYLFVGLLTGITILGAGCNPGCLRKNGIFKTDAQINTATDTPQTPSETPLPVTIERIPSSLAEAPQKFTIKKDGQVITEVIPTNGNPFTMRIFKQTEKFVYVGGYRDGMGGYVLFEADPTVIYQIDLETKNVVNLSRGELVVQDIYNDDMVAFSDLKQKKVVLRRINGNFQQEVKVPSKYGQFGNVRFSPDGTKVSYAAAVGNPDKEVGAVFMIDVQTGKQTLVSETNEPNKYFEVDGWKDNGTVDYVDRGVNEK